MGATTINRYDTLYQNMRRSFTVTSGSCQYSLGAYMRMKANEQTHEASMPVAIEQKPVTALAAIRTFVSEKLAVRVAPAPEKTLKSFPFRTSLAACLSAIALCTILFSGAILGSGVLGASSEHDTIVAELELTEDELASEENENV